MLSSRFFAIRLFNLCFFWVVIVCNSVGLFDTWILDAGRIIIMPPGYLALFEPWRLNGGNHRPIVRPDYLTHRDSSVTFLARMPPPPPISLTRVGASHLFSSI